jgi:hypothetical protein
MHAQLKAKLEALLEEMRHACEEDRLAAFDTLRDTFCAGCGREQDAAAQGGMRCPCANDD